MQRRMWWAVVLAVALLCGRASQAASADQEKLYRVTGTVSLGAPDRWDYLTYDSRSHRLYIAHGDRLTVADGRTGEVVGTVKGMPGGTHGIVIYHPTHTGYTDDGKAGEAVAFDTRTLRVTHRIKAEPDADGIVMDPASHHLFVIDGDSARLTVIDPTTNKVLATINGGGKLEFGVADGRGNLYVNGEEKREIVRVDTHANRVTAHWPISSCDSPHGIAIDRRSHRLFVTCENKQMVVVNADNGKVVATLPIGAFSDAAAFDPIRKRAFSSNGEGSVTVVSEHGPDKFSVAGTVQTMSGGRTMAIDPRTGRLFVVAAHITVNTSVPPTDYRHRYRIEPGSTKLLLLDLVN